MARATLESVARHASVSRQTVSNVLNAPHLVRPDTLARVRASIDELNYRPHHAARTGWSGPGSSPGGTASTGRCSTASCSR